METTKLVVASVGVVTSAAHTSATPTSSPKLKVGGTDTLTSTSIQAVHFLRYHNFFFVSFTCQGTIKIMFSCCYCIEGGSEKSLNIADMKIFQRNKKQIRVRGITVHKKGLKKDNYNYMPAFHYFFDGVFAVISH